MADIKLIAADMDHTLLTEKGELPPRFDDYIMRMEESGITFVIASGRPLYTLEWTFAKTFRNMSFICDNGGVVCHRGNVIFKSTLPVDEYRKMIEFVETETDGIPILCGLDTMYLSDKYTEYEEFLKKFYTKIVFVQNLRKVDAVVDKFTIYFPYMDSKEYYELVFKPKYSGKLAVTVGDKIWIDITNPGIDKGRAIRLLADKLGLQYDQMMAFGDAYNDIEMLRAVKYSYVVANADEEMRQYANYVTDSNDEFGVIKVINKVLQGKF
ncbi:MAG: Cof-type HAD-IIB family hydrolase [Bifidobacteriaceae bacterium]|jgi:Cof subfamily protein (haloacid dehalogenase superfamily)|nr:Cof-type HAD-IIB family hydrolase [Bifidobacteriaceae bacterium]